MLGRGLYKQLPLLQGKERWGGTTDVGLLKQSQTWSRASSMQIIITGSLRGNDGHPHGLQSQVALTLSLGLTKDVTGRAFLP